MIGQYNKKPVCRFAPHWAEASAAKPQWEVNKPGSVEVDWVRFDWRGSVKSWNVANTIFLCDCLRLTLSALVRIDSSRRRSILYHSVFSNIRRCHSISINYNTFFSDCMLLLYIWLIPGYYNPNHVSTQLIQTVRQCQIEYRGARVSHLQKAEDRECRRQRKNQGIRYNETGHALLSLRTRRYGAYSQRRGDWWMWRTGGVLEGPYYSTVCTMPVFAASLAAFCCDIISVNGSHMVVMRTYSVCQNRSSVWWFCIDSSVSQDVGSLWRCNIYR